jgi:exopolysaccharide biosynthesis polyprenyl glycosylphosphotransferase
MQQWIDGLLFGAGLIVAHHLRAYWVSIRKTGIINPDAIRSFHPDYTWLFVAVIPLSILVLEANDFYKRAAFSSRRLMAWQLGKSCAFCTVGLVVMMFLFRQYQAARGVIVLFGPCSFMLVYAKEEYMRWRGDRRRDKPQFKKRIVLVGDPEETRSLVSEVDKEHDFVVAGQLDLNQISVAEMVAFLHERSVNGVIISAGRTYFERVEQAIQACELEGIEAWLVADFVKTNISRTSVDDFFGRPVLVFHSGPQMPVAAMLKQAIDIVGALFLITLFSPLMLVAALLIKLTSRGPILFRQQRSGLNGEPFMMYKFRSMVTNAEQLKHELAALNEMTGPVFKISQDPRITKVGKFLRRFSIDEMPQLFNVICGEMSLVGPRPLPVDEVKRFDDLAHRRRLSVKPGLTCLWQVLGRNDVSDFKEWVRLDLEYIDHWSLWLDLKILWLTVPVVLLGKGAR